MVKRATGGGVGRVAGQKTREKKRATCRDQRSGMTTSQESAPALVNEGCGRGVYNHTVNRRPALHTKYDHAPVANSTVIPAVVVTDLGGVVEGCDCGGGAGVEPDVLRARVVPGPQHQPHVHPATTKALRQPGKGGERKGEG
jgi:hypothetical protein